jgi:hypothetical protein
MASTSGISCFGKLPFHREFLRFGLDGAAGEWVVRWIEAGHAALSRGEGAAPGGAWIRFATPLEGTAVVGVVRASSDGLRRHPIALFTTLPVGEREAWSLAPLTFAALWEGLEGLVDDAVGSVPELAERLAGPLQESQGVAARWEAGANEPIDRPWETLVGRGGGEAGHVALNLLVIADAQRQARVVDEGVGVLLPLPEDSERAAVHAAVWIRVVERAVGREAPRPVVVQVAAPNRLALFYRPVDGEDLRALLGAPGELPIDDVCETWQKFPPEDPALAAAVARLTEASPAPLASLSERVKQ